jgi:hypothetical protein
VGLAYWRAEGRKPPVHVHRELTLPARRVFPFPVASIDIRLPMSYIGMKCSRPIVRIPSLHR